MIYLAFRFHFTGEKINLDAIKSSNFHLSRLKNEGLVALL